MASTIPTLVSFHRKINVFAFLLLLVPLWSNIGVQAQLLIQVPGLPTCANSCADRAAFTSGCLPITQKCLCTPPAPTFSSATLTCAERSCTTPEIFTVRQALTSFCAAVIPSDPATSDTTSLTTETSISTTGSSTFVPTTSDPATETPTLTPTPSSTTTITVPPDSTTVVFETVTATSNAIASFRPSFGLEHGAWLTLLPTFLGLFFGILAIL